ncbi:MULTISPECIES: AMP-binding protein [unclassified Streptomyces]|uniref:AMP-binding protein n=1 Tax=unclassified Streptomyces TaxID=2593676 RepID=UPI0033C01F7F
MTSVLAGCTPWPEEFVDRYWKAGHWRGNTLDNLLRGWALQYGARTALVQGDTRLTYAQLNRRVDRMAAGIRLRGLRPEQRVVVQMPNVPEFVITVFALMRVGAIPVFCPMSHRGTEVSYVVRITEAAGYVGPSTYQGFDHSAMVADVAAQGVFLRRVFTYEPPGTSSPYGGLTIDPTGCHYFPLASVDAPPERQQVRGADGVAFFLLSGDSTGAENPRLVPRTHNDYAYQARAAAELLSLTEDDVYLAAMPAESNFAFGCPGIMGTFTVGGTVVLVEDPVPERCLTAIGRERVTVTTLEPAAAQRWLDVLPKAEADVNSLRLVQLAGGPTHHATATAERVPRELGCGVQRLFGMAEGLLTLTQLDDPLAEPEEPTRTTQSRPLSPDDEIRIVDANGKERPPGEPGELLTRGPYTIRGYYRAPDHNTRAFTPDGYFRTGVLAMSTPEGGVVVLGDLETRDRLAQS